MGNHIIVKLYRDNNRLQLGRLILLQDNYKIPIFFIGWRYSKIVIVFRMW